LWALIFLQVMMSLNLFLNFVAELNWDIPMLSDATRVGGMVSTSILISALMFFIRSLSLSGFQNKIAGFFYISGFIMAVHYMISFIIFLVFRYDGSIKYFGGYRYVPAYTVFILQGMAMLYSIISIYTTKPKTVEELLRFKILKKIVIVIIFLYPLSFIVDLVRYFFPPLWHILEEERLLLTPLYFMIVNSFFIFYSLKGFSIKHADSNPFPFLSVREADVAELLCKGKSYKFIAETLHVSLSTVQTHVKNIYRKAGVNTKEALILRNN
jgi:Bacterial regulatory proteins, luxR family